MQSSQRSRSWAQDRGVFVNERTRTELTAHVCYIRHVVSLSRNSRGNDLLTSCAESYLLLFFSLWIPSQWSRLSDQLSLSHQTVSQLFKVPVGVTLSQGDNSFEAQQNSSLQSLSWMYSSFHLSYSFLLCQSFSTLAVWLMSILFFFFDQGQIILLPFLFSLFLFITHPSSPTTLLM